MKYVREGAGSSNVVDLDVEKTKPVFRGIEGDKHFVNVILGNRSLEMFLKEMSSEDCQKTVDMYRMLKSMGVPVPNTLRIAEDGSGVLMTDVTEGGKYELLDNHNLHATTEVKNVGAICDEVAHWQDALYKKGWVGTKDGYSVIVDRNTGIGRLVFLDISSGVRTKEYLKNWFKHWTTEEEIAQFSHDQVGLIRGYLDFSNRMIKQEMR